MNRNSLNAAIAIRPKAITMDFYITCNCSYRTKVSPVRCGETIRCVSGENVAIPPLSELKSQNEAESIAASHAQLNNDHHVNDPKPVRYWAFPIAGLLILYGLFQAVTLFDRLDVGPQIIGMQVGVAAVAILGGFAMWKFAIPRG